MTPQRFEAEELDSASVEYLRTVRKHVGRGTPGVFLGPRAAGLTAARLPMWSGVAGGGLLLFALLVVWLVILQDPLRVALLATALFFLGGWMVVAWIRCLIARQRSDYLGHFKYFDPLYFWHTTGTGVWVTPLKGLLDARCRHNSGTTDSTVHVVLEEYAFDVNVRSDYLAEGLETYLREIARDGRGLPIERGFAALAHAGLDREDEDDEPDEPVVEAIPEPHRARMSLGWLRYPVVLVLFAVTFVLNYQLCKVWRDASLFGRVGGSQNPADLRAYLADHRNTRHRALVQKQLDAVHEKAAGALERAPGEPDLTKGLANLVRALRNNPVPVLTIGVVRNPKPDRDSMETILGPTVMPATASTLVRGLSAQMSPNQMNALVGAPLGERIVAFGEATEGFAMIQIECRLRRPPAQAEAGGPPGKVSVVWTVTLQADESAEKKTCRWKRDIAGTNPDDVEREFRQACSEFPGQFVNFLRNKIPANAQP
jgi:hypothetical protein